MGTWVQGGGIFLLRQGIERIYTCRNVYVCVCVCVLVAWYKTTSSLDLTPAIVAFTEALFTGLAPAAHWLRFVFSNEHRHGVHSDLPRLCRGSVDVLQTCRITFVSLSVVPAAVTRTGRRLAVGHVATGTRQCGRLLSD